MHILYIYIMYYKFLCSASCYQVFLSNNKLQLVWIFETRLNCAIFCVWFFELLSTYLSLLVVTQCFSRCILQPFSDAPCLSGHKNDSTWEIIFKVWLLIKQVISLKTIWFGLFNYWFQVCVHFYTWFTW